MKVKVAKIMTNEEETLPDLEESLVRTKETALTTCSWLLLFLLRLHAKHYNPDIAMTSLLMLFSKF